MGKKIISPLIKYKYKTVFEISLCLALLILIILFKFFPNLSKGENVIQIHQELFKVEDIAQTIQKNLPPPPPKPEIIVAVPADEVLQDVEISSTELNVNEKVAAPPPPPKSTKDKIVEAEPIYFVAVEEMPEPIGGVEVIQKKIIYPEIAKRAGVEGIVYILAYLNEEGDVVKVEVAKGVGGGCDEVAAKAVKETKFRPGKQRGKPVKVKVMVPVKFRLQQST